MGFGGCRDECFASAATVDDPLGIEFAVRLEDGVGIDLEVRDDVLHLRELVAGLHPTEPDRLPHLLHELHADRHARSAVELKLDYDRARVVSAGSELCLVGHASRVRSERPPVRSAPVVQAARTPRPAQGVMGCEWRLVVD